MSTSVSTSFSISTGTLATATMLVSADIDGEKIPLTGAQTYDVDIAMMPTAGLQVLLVSVDLKDAAGVAATAPVRVNLTPGGYVMLPPGGALAIAAPGTAAGVTALQLVSTANAVVRLAAHG